MGRMEKYWYLDLAKNFNTIYRYAVFQKFSKAIPEEKKISDIAFWLYKVCCFWIKYHFSMSYELKTEKVYSDSIPL